MEGDGGVNKKRKGTTSAGARGRRGAALTAIGEALEGQSEGLGRDELVRRVRQAGSRWGVPTAVDEGVRPSLANGDDWRDMTTASISKLVEACWSGKASERPTFMGAEGIVAKLDQMEAKMTKGSDEEAHTV
mgnify:CR=1 FL=1